MQHEEQTIIEVPIREVHVPSDVYVHVAFEDILIFNLNELNVY